MKYRSRLILWALGAAFLLFPASLLAQQSLSEAELVRFAQKDNPTTQKIKADEAMNEFENSLTQSQFDTRLDGEYSYSTSKEDGIIQFIPVFKPQKLMQMGLSQRISYGAEAKLGFFSQQISTANGMINNATQVGGRFNLEVDLWKNFLGRLDRSELKSKKISRKISQLQGSISQKNFVNGIRKVYWSAVGNELSLKLSARLIDSAKQQLREANRRAREGLADKGDIARNKAQVQSREAAVLFFTYKREVLLSNLKSSLPGLQGKKYRISTNTVQSVEATARMCGIAISVQNDPNPAHSSYTKIISLLEEQKPLEMRIAESTDSMDVKVSAQYQTSGVDTSHSRAYDAMAELDKPGYQAGVAISIPLGGSLSRARKSRVTAVHNRIQSRKEGLNLKLSSEHQKVKTALLLLEKAAASQKAIVQSLGTSLKQTKKKYRQARIPLATLILEQDNMFNAELQLIDTKTQIIHLLLDYFTIFPEYPCKLNQLAGVR